PITVWSPAREARLFSALLAALRVIRRDRLSARRIPDLHRAVVACRDHAIARRAPPRVPYGADVAAQCREVGAPVRVPDPRVVIGARGDDAIAARIERRPEHGIEMTDERPQALAGGHAPQLDLRA